METSQYFTGYRLMLISRAIDEACKRVIANGRPVPNYHSATGQEALYAGAGVALQSQDYLLYNYRAFATLLAKGVTLGELANDLLMTAHGTTRGHGGIMHVTRPEHGVVGRNGVFGSKFGIALGLAQSAVIQQRDAAVLCMFGEAEGNRGPLYEALNIAILRRLPVVFLAENNGFAVAARTADLYCTGDMSSLFQGFPLPITRVDGNDLVAVHSAVSIACARAQAGEGPSYIECQTYRLDPHHAHDNDGRYRTQEELASHWRNEPLSRAEEYLVGRGLSEEEMVRERTKVYTEVDAAFADALGAPGPDLDGVLGRVYYREGREALHGLA